MVGISARNFCDSYIPRMLSANHSILAYRLTIYLAPVLSTQNGWFMNHSVFIRQILVLQVFYETMSTKAYG